MAEKKRVQAETPGIDPKQHGHATLKELFAEIAQDQQEAKREDAHWYGREIFGEGKEVKEPEPEQENERGLEM